MVDTTNGPGRREAGAPSDAHVAIMIILGVVVMFIVGILLLVISMSSDWQ